MITKTLTQRYFRESYGCVRRSVKFTFYVQRPSMRRDRKQLRVEDTPIP